MRYKVFVLERKVKSLNCYDAVGKLNSPKVKIDVSLYFSQRLATINYVRMIIAHTYKLAFFFKVYQFRLVAYLGISFLRRMTTQKIPSIKGKFIMELEG